MCNAKKRLVTVILSCDQIRSAKEMFVQQVLTTIRDHTRFIEEMYKWSAAEKPAKVLDVGCGIGGTSRYLAAKLGDETSVTGITLSPNQV